MPETRAAAIIEQGTRAEQRVVTGTLADLAQQGRGSAAFESPALLIVGEVTRLHETLHWFNTPPPAVDASAISITKGGSQHEHPVDHRQGFADAIGNTPLIRLNRFSEQTGCEILGKAEFMNPGGSVKDRAARAIIDDAERSGRLKPGGTVVEGTAGNTGIGLAHVCNARGYRCVIVMPDNQSPEKYQLIETLGAEVLRVKTVPYSDPNHYQKVAAPPRATRFPMRSGPTSSTTPRTAMRTSRRPARRSGSRPTAASTRSSPRPAPAARSAASRDS